MPEGSAVDRTDKKNINEIIERVNASYDDRYGDAAQRQRLELMQRHMLIQRQNQNGSATSSSNAADAKFQIIQPEDLKEAKQLELKRRENKARKKAEREKRRKSRHDNKREDKEEDKEELSEEAQAAKSLTNTQLAQVRKKRRSVVSKRRKNNAGESKQESVPQDSGDANSQAQSRRPSLARLKKAAMFVQNRSSADALGGDEKPATDGTTGDDHKQKRRRPSLQAAVATIVATNRVRRSTIDSLRRTSKAAIENRPTTDAPDGGETPPATDGEHEQVRRRRPSLQAAVGTIVATNRIRRSTFDRMRRTSKAAITNVREKLAEATNDEVKLKFHSEAARELYERKQAEQKAKVEQQLERKRRATLNDTANAALAAKLAEEPEVASSRDDIEAARRKSLSSFLRTVPSP